MRPIAPELLGRLYREHAPALLLFARQWGDGAEDVVHAAFLKLAEFAQGGNAGQWFERAYAEDPGDPQIALGYGKSLLTQGQAGAAIFVLEPQIRAGAASPGARPA